MNCTTAREIFPALLDHRTASTEYLEARAHLAHCPDCQREFAALSQTLAALDSVPVPVPSARLRRDFYAMLEEEKHSATSVRTASERERIVRQRRIWRWIMLPALGCALLLFGFIAGARHGERERATAQPDFTQHELTELRKQMTAQNRQIATQSDQIARQNEQLNKMTTLVAFQLMQQQQGPANDRLEGVLAAAKEAAPTDQVLDDLVSALAFDPNANVRLRALEALYPHAEREVVRAGVLGALPREQNPLVQLELIEFLAASRSPAAGAALERLAQNHLIDASVREAARRAVAQLSLSTTNDTAPATNESPVPN